MAKKATGFSSEIARRLVGVTYRQLVYWDTTGLIRPSIEKAKGRGSRRVYSFEDLVELRVIQRLLAAGVTLKTVRKAAHYVRKHFTTVTRPLARLALIVDGKSILVRTLEGKELIDATANGQVMINFAVGSIAEAVRGEVSVLSAPREMKLRIQRQTYTAILTPDLRAGGYSIAVKGLRGVFTEANNLTEARKMIKEAISLHLEMAAPRASTRKAR